MDKDGLKQKIAKDRERIGANLKDNVNSVDWKEKRRRVRTFFKKAGKAFYRGFKKLPRDMRRAVIITVISAGAVSGIKIAKDIKQVVDDFKLNQEVKRHNKSAKERLKEVHHISDRQSFNDLYGASLPLIQVSMFPSECLILNPYSDNGKKIANTTGLGSYWYPKNGDPKSSEWILASEYFKQHGAHSISGETALDLSDGWFGYREGGRVLRNMYDALKGIDLKPNEFAAIASVMYNSEKTGRELCEFVHDHYKDPLACAAKIAGLHEKSSFKGLPKRHLHEAYLYLNYDGYVHKMYDFFVKTGVNSKGDFYAQTSVTALSSDDVARGRAAIESGDKDRIVEEQNKISSYICKNGRTVREVLNDNILVPSYLEDLLAFSFVEKEGVSLRDIVDGKDAASAEQMYQETIQIYDNALGMEMKGQQAKSQKEFQKALEGFQKIIDSGHNGADLHNDMAITYYHLGEYQRCIDESKLVLQMGEEELYPAANFNAAIAYEKLGNFDRALANYKAYGKNGGDSTKVRSRIESLQVLKAQQNLNQSSR